MSVLLAENWWSLVIRGLAAILLGLITIFWPGIRLGSLVSLFGVYALIDGLAGIAGALRAGEAHERWGALLIEGLAGIMAWLITIAWPVTTALSLVYVIAAWVLVTGVFEMIAALRLRRYIAGEWLLLLSSLASLVLGILLLALPLARVLAIAFWVGVYGLVFGSLLIALGFRLQKWAKTPAAESQFG